jgi:RNA-directed DNA polymerase
MAGIGLWLLKDINDFKKKYPNFNSYDINIEENTRIFNLPCKEGGMYRHFEIPKKKGNKMRPIDTCKGTPLDELHEKILNFINVKIHWLPMGCSFAYQKDKSVYDHAQEHLGNKWFAKFDFTNFFGSCNKEIIINGLKTIPAIALTDGLAEAIADVAVLENGYMIQGTKISPVLANIIATPFDFEFKNWMLQNYRHCKYTRYADDITISSTKPIDSKLLEDKMNQLLTELYKGNIKLNPDKTVMKHTGRLYILGCKMNEHDAISFGWENKKKLKSMIYNAMSLKIRNKLSTEEAQKTLGYLAWCHTIDPEGADNIEKKYIKKFNINKKLTDYLLKD